MIVSCEVCGKEFKTKPGLVKQGGGRFCSHTCRGLAGRNRVIRTCQTCGKEFEVTPSQTRRGRGKFCSRECAIEGKRGDKCSRWNGNTVVVACPVCGRSFESRRDKIEQGKGIYCSRQCASFAHRGPGNPMWNGGSSFEPYPPTFNEQFRQAIRERDHHICAICRLFGKMVHHINYVKDDTTPENCVTLCNSCHSVTNGNREYWEQELSGLLRVRADG